MTKHRIALLGSTGSIGRQTLDVVSRYPDHFEITTLTANDNWELLARQAAQFMPDSVVIANKGHYKRLQDALSSLPIKVYAGETAVAQFAAGGNVDTVVNALVGYAGLAPTISALEAGKKLALANKESLVVAGEIVMRLAIDNNAPVIPVDSEHSAIYQCLVGEVSPVERLILTASGGPFRNTPADELHSVTVRQALTHPNWEMGPKITIDSATMLNKGFEVIEARWLFGIPPERIEVLVHPQSIIHSMAEFADGAIKAQLGTPDMRLPIQYALTFPHRWDSGSGRFDFTKYTSLTFDEPDTARFPALRLAFDSLRQGGNACCVLNAANEIAVASFLDGRIRFTDIPRVITHALEKVGYDPSPTVESCAAYNTEARAKALEFVAVL